MNYKPKFYDCILNGIRTQGSKHLFHFTEKNTEGRNQMQIEVDQSSDLIFGKNEGNCIWEKRQIVFNKRYERH